VKRVVGIDYGRKRLGIAVSDPLGITAQGSPTLEVSGFEDALRKVSAYLADFEVETIVLGLPLNMDGSQGPMVDEVKRFGDGLHTRTQVPVTYLDERLTSAQAKQMLQTDDKRGRGKGQVDRVAASLLLDAYLQGLREE